MFTGSKVFQLGLYASVCCHRELIFEAGDLFTECFKCGDTNWKLVERVISWRELEQLEEHCLEDRPAA